MAALLINLAHKAVPMRLWNKDGAPGSTDGTRAATSVYSLKPRLSHVEEFVDDRAALRNPRGSTRSPAEPFDAGALTQ